MISLLKRHSKKVMINNRELINIIEDDSTFSLFKSYLAIVPNTKMSLLSGSLIVRTCVSFGINMIKWFVHTMLNMFPILSKASCVP